MNQEPLNQDPAKQDQVPEAPETPLLSVVKGNPTPEELAALTAVVASLSAPTVPARDKPPVRHWVRRQRLGLDPTPGPGAWRRSKG